MIAKKFKHIEFKRETLIFASGVSNSQENSSAEFERESALITQTALENRNFTIVYFSTCSINQKISSPYIIHKLAMEEKIKENFDKYHIFRLPQVVGSTNNSTLISFFTRSIIENKKVVIQKYAARCLIDVDDLVRITQYLVNEQIGRNSIQNIASGNNTLVIDIFNEISLITKKIGLFEYDYCGEKYNIQANFILDSLGENDRIFRDNYWKDTLHRHVPILKEIYQK